MKKFAMLFIVLVGTSLAVYAAVIVPQMRNLSVNEITATTARIRMECLNTDTLLIYAKSDILDDYHLIGNLTVGHGDSGKWVECEFSIGNMQPDTPYYIQVETVLGNSETGDPLVCNKTISFRTAIE